MNVLLIFSDQQHKNALGKRNPQFITPNLDFLCDNGILFDNAYSNNPVCGPFRGCLMTGQLPCHCNVLNNGDPLPQNTESLPQAMQRAGYHTAYVGKWHLGGTGNGAVKENLRPGFDRFTGYQCYNGFNPNPPYNNQVIFYDENNKAHEFNAHRTDVTTDLAIENLQDMSKQKKPFFLTVSYQAPHYPEQPSEKYEALYKNTIFTHSCDYKAVDPYTPTYSPYSPRPFEGCPDYQNYGGNMEKYQRLYAALCTQVDHGIGRILQTLKSLNLYDDTLIIYTSDHGDMQGSHGLKNKCYPYEQSCAVPFIVRYPGGRKGITSKQPVSGIDIYPTLLDLAKTSTRTNLDGTSILPYLSGKSDHTQEYIIAEHSMNGQNWRMIRSIRYKLITSLTYVPTELYDLTEDPYEMNNLLNSKNPDSYFKEINQLLNVLKSRTSPIISRKSAEPSNS